MNYEMVACEVVMAKTITIHDELSIKWINQKAK